MNAAVEDVVLEAVQRFYEDRGEYPDTVHVSSDVWRELVALMQFRESRDYLGFWVGRAFVPIKEESAAPLRFVELSKTHRSRVLFDAFHPEWSPADREIL